MHHDVVYRQMPVLVLGKFEQGEMIINRRRNYYLTGILDKLLSTTRQDLALRKKTRSHEEVKAAAPRRQAGAFHQAVAAPGLSVIAEIKRASPSKGDIRPGLVVDEIARAYEGGGASAISVLTEERYFKGSLADLQQARKASRLPILRKDFIVDSYQIWEAAEAGADAVLLIVAALPAETLQLLICEAAAAGLDALVEVHTPEELQTAVAAGAKIIGVNNRNLSTFETSLKTTLDMIESFPDAILKVSESGIKNREDVLLLKQAGVDAILVGETLMRSPNPGDKIKELLT